MARDTLDAGAMASAESLGGLPLLTTEKALFGCLVLQHPSWDLNQALCSLILSHLSNRIGNSQLASLLGVARDGAAPETPVMHAHVHTPNSLRFGVFFRQFELDIRSKQSK